ncbi:glycoside hydrolase family 65 [Paenibacillus sp. CC-CFT747]|nr:glycoside hydrolase family 65 [Paenibacillus sp. CC-CFT747]
MEQTLDLWTGILESRFLLDDASITVRTCCHPARDLIAVQVESDLLSEGAIECVYRFPYGSQHKQSVVWDRPEAHQTDLTAGDRHAVFKRTLDQDRYEVITEWNVPGELIGEKGHHFVLKPRTEGNRFECVILFTPEEGRFELPSYKQTAEASSDHWISFWSDGGFIDFGDATDPRAPELERRTVLSLYQTYINSSGSLPPQETGYVFNSWDGKFHLEMHWWHAVHFALWGRPQLLENSLPWYQSILPIARETAKSQGYEGARWPKCVAPDGRQMPCYIEPFLIWQQPHPIYYCELLYRSHPDGEVLERYQELVHESALFMASFVEWDEAGSRYVLGPPVAPAQERYDHETTINPGFELAYWHFGLETAQQWRMRLGLPREEKWDHILANLSPLPVVDGVYVAAETAPDTFSNKEYTADHPTMAASMGLLPGAMADKETMRHTYDKIIKVWNWKSAWGWDFPMMAMTAARLGMPEKAVDVLLMDTEKNRYLPNGHCFQNHSLTIYLPGNGGLLSAVAMMAAGWTGSDSGEAPGFPNDGTWKIRSEGLMTYI